MRDAEPYVPESHIVNQCSHLRFRERGHIRAGLDHGCKVIELKGAGAEWIETEANFSYRWPNLPWHIRKLVVDIPCAVFVLKFVRIGVIERG